MAQKEVELALYFHRVMPILRDVIRERDNLRSKETQEEWEAFCAKYAKENDFPMRLFERAEKALNSDEYQFKEITREEIGKFIDLIKGKIAYGDVYGKIIKDR